MFFCVTLPETDFRYTKQFRLRRQHQQQHQPLNQQQHQQPKQQPKQQPNQQPKQQPKQQQHLIEFGPLSKYIPSACLFSSFSATKK